MFIREAVALGMMVCGCSNGRVKCCDGALSPTCIC
jgi:hypothetical protein